MEETKIVVIMYQIQSNPNVSNCQQGNYGTFAKAWALIRLLVHVRAKQMVGVEWRQDNRRKSPDIIQSWLSRQQKVPASCFLFHPAARPLHQPLPPPPVFFMSSKQCTPLCFGHQNTAYYHTLTTQKVSMSISI